MNVRMKYYVHSAKNCITNITTSQELTPVIEALRNFCNETNALTTCFANFHLKVISNFINIQYETKVEISRLKGLFKFIYRNFI